jgi:hypothetical protein
MYSSVKGRQPLPAKELAEAVKFVKKYHEGIVEKWTNFFTAHSHPQYNKYKKPENFKRFKIENGNIVWGKDWDMIFPVYDLYTGKINS